MHIIVLQLMIQIICLMNKSNEDNHTNQIMMMILSQTSRGGGGRRCMPKPTAEHVAAMAQ